MTCIHGRVTLICQRQPYNLLITSLHPISNPPFLSDYKRGSQFRKPEGPQSKFTQIKFWVKFIFADVHQSSTSVSLKFSMLSYGVGICEFRSSSRVSSGLLTFFPYVVSLRNSTSIVPCKTCTNFLPFSEKNHRLQAVSHLLRCRPLPRATSSAAAPDSKGTVNSSN